jgi:hypothetical protein
LDVEEEDFANSFTCDDAAGARRAAYAGELIRNRNEFAA